MPGGLALVPWALGPSGPLAKDKLDRAGVDYTKISRDNVFIGYQPPEKKTTPKETNPNPNPVQPTQKDDENGPDPLEFYRLIFISIQEGEGEALLYSVYHDSEKQLRSFGFKKDFYIYGQSGSKTLLKGRVLKIDFDGVYFQDLLSTKTKTYFIRMDQTLKEAMEEPVPEAQLIKVGIKVDKSS